LANAAAVRVVDHQRASRVPGGAVGDEVDNEWVGFQGVGGAVSGQDGVLP
jgi:hypothetical protein